jgi:hypothetical protein
MAAILGEKSLTDVHHEGLDEVRYSSSLSRPRTDLYKILSEMTQFYPGFASHDSHSLGVPVLDTLLEIFAPKTSGVAPNALIDQVQSGREIDQDQPGEFLTEDEEMLLHSQVLTDLRKVTTPVLSHCACNITTKTR